MKLFIAFILLLLISVVCYPQEMGGDLFNLAVIKNNVKSKRISSYDRSGKNNDMARGIKPGEFFTLCDIKGPGIINHIWITISPGPEMLSRNDIILRMFWDGKDYPSVESPIGPFFGQGWNESYDFSSLPLAAGPVKGKALVSYFAMPFSDGAKIQIENQTDQEIRSFYYYVDYIELGRLQDNSGRFHAWFNSELTQALPGGENEWELLGEHNANKTGSGNYVIVDLFGKGQFAGVNYYVHSPTPLWYGEGDDMIYIDGDTSSTLHGTGTEDYFNTSWCPRSMFSHPYFGYARVNDDIGWLGRTHIYRFNISDPIYFDKSFKFTIEHGHNNCLTLHLSSVAYWYQSEAVKVDPIPDKETRSGKKFINYRDIHRWRDIWRKSKGSIDTLWGKEE